MILIILLLLLQGCAEKEVTFDSLGIAKSATFAIDAKEDTIVLSPMNEGETVMTKFLVRNRSGKTLQIDRIHSGCGCTSAVWSKEPLEDGDNVPVTLFFNSNGQFGKQFKTIEIWSIEGEMCRIFLATEVKF